MAVERERERELHSINQRKEAILFNQFSLLERGGCHLSTLRDGV